MSRTLLENIHVVHVGASAFVADFSDYTSGDITTDVVSLAEYNRATWFIIKGAGAAGTATIFVESCDTAVPGTPTDIGYTYKLITAPDTESAKVKVAAGSEILMPASADVVYIVEVTAEDLYLTDQFVRLILDETDGTACDGAILCILSEPRYTQGIMHTAVA